MSQCFHRILFIGCLIDFNRVEKALVHSSGGLQPVWHHGIAQAQQEFEGTPDLIVVSEMNYNEALMAQRAMTRNGQMPPPVIVLGQAITDGSPIRMCTKEALPDALAELLRH